MKETTLHQKKCDYCLGSDESFQPERSTAPRKKYKSRTARTVLALMALALGASAQNRLFSSGFEGNTALEAIPSSATSDDYQHFSGSDNTTGYTWPMSFWGAYAVSTGMHPIVGGSNSVSSYINNYIESVTGHTGSASRALRMNITGPAPGFCCVQSTFLVAGLSQPVTDFYTRFWVKLNPELLSQVQANGGNFWRTLLELKTTTDYRIATFIVGNSSGIPSWRVIVDNNPNGTLPPCPAGACWSADNTSVSVPASQWFLMEYYLHRSTGSDGRFFWAVNGQTLVDHSGPTYGANQENINFLALLNLYGDGNNMSPAYQWIDDVEVWDVPPCATLPCGAGSGTTADTQAPTTPTNLTASAASTSQINLSWNASTDNVGVAGYRIYRNGGTSPIASTAGTSYQDSGLTASTSYSYTVAAYDAAGNTSARSLAASATTASAPPPPSVGSCPAAVASAWTACYYSDQNLTTLGVVRTDPTILFDWGAGSPDPAIPADHFSARWKGIFNFSAASYTFTVTADDGFRLYLDGVIVMDHWADESATTYTQTLATTAGNHAVTLEYYEDAGSAVANLQWQLASTASAPAPTTPTTLTASAVSSSQINLSWTASTDSMGVAGYRIYRNGGTTPIATSASAGYQDSGLVPATPYTYEVSAYDSLGDASAESAPASATTAPSSVSSLTIAIVSPVNNSTLPANSNVNVAVNVTGQPVSVIYRLDGNTIGIAPASPWGYGLNTSGLKRNVWHNLAAVATDASGNSVTSSSVRFRVQ
jgi:chitodextrinase